MTYDPRQHGRRSIRLHDCDYSYPGTYFVTICAAGMRCVFGRIESGQVILNPLGEVVNRERLKTASLRPYLELDRHVVMPNHFHGILTLHQIGRDEASGGTARRAPTEEFGGPVTRSLPTIVRAFKSAVTKAAGQSSNNPQGGVWQRGYFEHIIRDEDSLQHIRDYIVGNPRRWESDRENPLHVGKDEFDRWLSRFKIRPPRPADKPK